MAKGYWLTFYRSITNHSALAEYANLAGPAIEARGGRFLVRGSPAKAYEGGLHQRVVLIEFENVENAVQTYERTAYQAAVKVLEGAVEREVRIVEGVE